jgi:hypothetical protein
MTDGLSKEKLIKQKYYEKDLHIIKHRIFSYSEY